MNILKIFLLLSLKLFVEAEGFDLNFQQNDYKIKFERVELVRYNQDLLNSASIKTFKYNRTLAVVNATFSVKTELGNDLVSTLQAYKFMSNEYRQFPMRFAANSCKAVAVNVGGLKSGFERCGNFHGCPILKGKTYHMCNWYPDQSKLPPFIPNGEYKMEIQLMHFSDEVFFINVYLTVFRPFV